MSGRATSASGDSGKFQTFWASSIYGAKTRRGLVELAEADAEGHRTWSTQITPAEARAIGLSILEAAEGGRVRSDLRRVPPGQDQALVRAGRVRAPGAADDSRPPPRGAGS